VLELRAAMFGSISGADVAAVMQAVVKRGSLGDLRAARTLIDLLLRPGAAQPLVVSPGDVTRVRGVRRVSAAVPDHPAARGECRREGRGEGGAAIPERHPRRRRGDPGEPAQLHVQRPG
jgi:hypothetical protein